MAVKPVLDPKWSTSNDSFDNIEPTESLKIGGVPAGGVWGREFLNWQFYAISQWIDWVRSSALDKDNNLSDLANAGTARTNLGLNTSATTIAANTTGSAAKWATARTIILGGALSGNVAIDGSASVTLSAQVSNDSHSHSASTITAATTSVAGVTQLNNTISSSSTTQAATANAARLAYNRAAEYAPSKTGAGASGTWGINITGNAGYATSAGSATTATSATKWATARTMSIAGSEKSVDGTGNPTWTVSDLKLNGSLSGSGWQRLPSGFIIQWGSLSMAQNSTQTVNLPMAFPITNAISIADSMEPNAEVAQVYSKSNTQISIVYAGPTTRTIQWFAIGH